MTLRASLQRFHAWQRAPHRYKSEALLEYHCANCGNKFTGNYCPVCGQHGNDGRITWKSVWENFLSVWSIDSHSFPSTIFQLLVRPGYLIGEYLSGHKKVSYPPANMLFTVAILYALLKQMFNLDASAVTISDYENQVFNQVVAWLKNNPGWGMMSMTMNFILPTWILFRFSPRHTFHSLPEGVFIQFFMGTLMLICSFLAKLIPIFFIFIPFYYYYCFQQLFGYRFWGTVWRLLISLFVWFFLIIAYILAIYAFDKSDEFEPLQMLIIIAIILAIVSLILLAGYWISKWEYKRRIKKQQLR